jgi:hypothetical protein
MTAMTEQESSLCPTRNNQGGPIRPSPWSSVRCGLEGLIVPTRGRGDGQKNRELEITAPSIGPGTTPDIQSAAVDPIARCAGFPILSR